jgi:hypothetical protein
MHHHELRNYGNVLTGKLSAHVMMTIFTSVPKELGFIGTPKFLTKMQGKQRLWKGRVAKMGKPRGITHEEYLEGMENSLAYYTALEATCGKEKGLEAYQNSAPKVAGASYEEFFPSAKDFRSCGDHWQAAREYFLEFLQALARENIVRFEVLQSPDDEFHAHLSECAVQDMYHEVGYHQIAPITCEAMRVVLTKLCGELGADFKRESWLCRGDPTCDWHFLRYKSV